MRRFTVAPLARSRTVDRGALHLLRPGDVALRDEESIASPTSAISTARRAGRSKREQGLRQNPRSLGRPRQLDSLRGVAGRIRTIPAAARVRASTFRHMI